MKIEFNKLYWRWMFKINKKFNSTNYECDFNILVSDKTK